MAYGSAYVVFLWAWWGATGSWVYPSLDWSEPASLAAYVFLPVLLVRAPACRAWRASDLFDRALKETFNAPPRRCAAQLAKPCLHTLEINKRRHTHPLHGRRSSLTSSCLAWPAYATWPCQVRVV